MPIWVPILAAAIALLVVVPVGEFVGLDTAATFAVSAMMVASATAVVVLGWLVPWLIPGQPRPAAWLVWLFLTAPPVLSALIIVGNAIHDGRAVPPAPVGSCQRCGSALFADHTGRRYFAVGTGYLCPPPFQQPGQRRHQLVPAEGTHGTDRA